MENAVDALKIAFAVFVFAIAVALTFSMVGQARATSDTILAINDKTNLYEYIDSSENNASDQDRIVGFETILPTIYRYAKEQYAVTITDEIGTPIVRYDLYTEGFMQDWDATLKKANQGNDDARHTINGVLDRIALVDEIIRLETGQNNEIQKKLITGNPGSYKAGELYKGKNITGNNITCVAPWIGNANVDTIDRIKADLSGKEYTKGGKTYYGKNLNQYKDYEFKEKFIEIQTSGETVAITDEEFNIEYSIETIKGNKKLEIVYIAQKKQ